MSAALAREATAQEEREQEEASGRPRWPDWFEAARAEAHADFEASPLPHRKDEAWRYSDLGAVDISGFVPARRVHAPEALVEASKGLEEAAARMVFGNNELLSRRCPALPDGVVCLPLEQAAREHPAIFRRHFMAQPVELGSHRFAALHKSRVETGAFIYVPAGVEVPLPIEIHHWAEGDHPSLYPHTLVVLEEGASAVVLDIFRSADNRRAFVCGVNDLRIGARARLTYVALQDWSRETLAFHLNSTTVAAGGSSTALTAHLGGGYIRGESYSRLEGPGARSEMLALSPLDGHRQADLRTLQDHASREAASDLLYLNTLDDSSRAVFSGLIKVREGAHRTDAYQKVRNLLLSESAEANSMPGLEILADDVRCTHGATSGEISEEELFYLEARGIPRPLGRRLIINGFFQAVIDRLPEPKLREFLAEIVAARLGVPAQV
ncbi:MAG: Fe-S cluster assembly protein SufD [Terrimicrobiaceae bacterium]|nr:Fe-S cluster assembly protein SufD [Terrimicrobiaceae bacterium]